jgi:hypothetical protein
MQTDLRITEALAAHVREAVNEGGRSQAEITAPLNAPSAKTLRKLMTDVGSPVTLTSLNRLDAALGWRVGTGYRLAAGLPVEYEVNGNGNSTAKTLPVYGIGPETGRLIYRAAAAADDIGVSVDAAPGEHVDLDALIARMEDIAENTAKVAAMMRQAARDAHDEFRAGN